ncbi:hypothetical protein V6N13_071980 [Hibiscus sabdariffa]
MPCGSHQRGIQEIRSDSTTMMHLEVNDPDDATWSLGEPRSLRLWSMWARRATSGRRGLHANAERSSHL